jgi:flagellar hook-associated protein 2
MSTSSTSSSTASSASTGFELTSLGSSSALQITGLASGLDTDSIIDKLMALKQVPLTNLQNESSGLTAEDTQLTTLQTALETVSTDAQALLDPSLFDTTQAVSSSNSTLVSASNSSGAGIGGYQVSVSQLANSAQRTYAYAPPTSADTVTIDGQAVTISAGESISSLVSSINGNTNLDVYAAATDSGTLVLSNRQTGDTGSGFIQVADSGGALTEQTAKAKEGQDAQFTVDGQSGSSSSNTVTNAIAGVTLQLNGVTTTAGPVTVNVAAPAPSASAIETALTKFVTDYNTAIGDVQTQLSTAPSSSDPTVGTLYGDQDLTDMLSQMRQAMYSTISGLPSGLSNLLELGISTGATTGSGSVSSSALSGDLTFDTSTFEAALQSNPSGVQELLTGFASSFSNLVDAEAGPGGTISERINANTSQMSDLSQQISDMQASLNDQQQQLTNQFAAMEAALSSNQSESSWLTSQIAQLP